MKLKHIIFCCLFGVMGGKIFSYGQEQPVGITGSIFFQLGKHSVDLSYENNENSLANLIHNINTVTIDTNYIINEVKISGMASPDGKYESTNLRLAQRRAESVKDYLLPYLNIPDSCIVIENKGENWDGLRKMVKASSMPFKEETLFILDSITDRNKRKATLMFLREGVPYQYIRTHFFPKLRNGVAVSSSYNTIQFYRQKNWEILQKEIGSSTLSETEKDALIYIFTHLPDSRETLHQIDVLLEGKMFNDVRSNFLSKAFLSSDSLNIEDHPSIRHIQENSIKGANPMDDWKYLRYLVSTSTMENRTAILDIIDSNDSPAVKLEAFMKMDDGATLKNLSDRYLPAILYNTENSQDMWSLMRKQVEASDMPEKETLLHFLQETPPSAENERQLKALHNGQTYRALQNALFIGQLAISNNDTINTLQSTAIVNSSLSSSTWDNPEGKSVGGIVGREPYRWALKSNLLYDAILIPNIELEYRLSPRWSVNFEGQFTWISKPNKNVYYQIAAAGLDLRRWMNRQAPFYGHYIGIYYNGGLYDLENGKLGYTGECYLSTGLIYGYLKPLSRKLSLDFGFGLGFLSTNYKKYKPVDGRYVYLTTDRLNYFGPTKAKVAIVWKWNKENKRK